MTNETKEFNYCDDCPGDGSPGRCATISSMNRCPKDLLRRFEK